MPLYSYRCGSCDQESELLIRSGDVPTCPACGGQDLQRQLSRVAPPGQTAGLLRGARTQAAREGHLSNFSRAERKG